MNRRSFLGSILALAAAPAIVRASSIMPVRPIDASPTGLQALFEGEKQRQAAINAAVENAIIGSTGAFMLYAADGRVLATVPAGAAGPAKGGRIDLAPTHGVVLQSGVIQECRLVLPAVGTFRCLEDLAGKALTPGQDVFVHASLSVDYGR